MTGLPDVVPCTADVTVQVTAPVTHLCPHVDEVDEGTVTITWRCTAGTFELHSLADYLAGFKDCQISHENLTDRIRHDLAGFGGVIEDVTVTARFTTAGMDVEVVSGAVPVDTVHG